MRNPFVVGSWVRGERFYGRERELQEVLDGPRAFVWVLGTRRVGKTSFLKELERRATARDESAGPKLLPIFWDMEGSHDLNGLRDGLLESVEAIESRLATINVTVPELEALDVFGALRLLRRRARESGTVLLLLCDECEELISIERAHPEALPRLRRLLQEGESVRAVLAATKRLFLLERSAVPDTSPFLHGFVPPLYLGRLSDADATALLTAGGIDETTARTILVRTDNHPYLLQLVGKWFCETGDLESVFQEIAADDLVSHFFAVDYEYLTTHEKEVVLHVARTRAAASHDLAGKLAITAGQANALLQGLHRLGYVRQEGGVCTIPNWFFQSWLQRHHGIEPLPAAAIASVVGSFDAESSLELLRRAHDGDRQALLHLCARYESAFRRWAEARLPHGMRSQLDTDDLLRETLHGVILQTSPETEGELWDHLRREFVRRIDEEKRRLDAARDAAGDPPAGASLCPQEEVVGRDRMDRYEMALGRLEPASRQAIVMRLEMGCTWEQLAESLGKTSTGAARMTVCRALVQLAREMSHE